MGRWSKVSENLLPEVAFLYKSCLPNSLRYDREGDVLDQWHACGVQTVFSLLPWEEATARSGRDLESQLSSNGFTSHHFPVTNFGAWNLDEFQNIVSTLNEALACGERIAVHCHAGVGRTGTLIAGLLILRGSDLNEAVSCIEGHGMSVESHGQRGLLERYELYVRG